MAIAVLAIVMITATVLLSTQLVRGGPTDALTGAPDDCEAINVSDYNAVIADAFTGVPLEPFHDVHYADDGSWWCSTKPDAHQYCPTASCDSAEFGGLIYNRLSIDFETDCSDICGLTDDQREEIRGQERKGYEDWSWAIPGHIFHTEEASWHDYHPVYGSIISVYQYENLQIIIKLQVFYDGPVGSSDRLMEAFVDANRETAELLRDRAVERR